MFHMAVDSEMVWDGSLAGMLRENSKRPLLAVPLCVATLHGSLLGPEMGLCARDSSPELSSQPCFPGSFSSCPRAMSCSHHAVFPSSHHL